jgi:hypothetical protein
VKEVQRNEEKAGAASETKAGIKGMLVTTDGIWKDVYNKGKMENYL